MSSDSSQRRVLLTVDYEIFGNGTGDVRQHMVEPTERMARICEKHEVPLTIFFEAEEYLGFCRYERELKSLLGYDPAQLVREQVRSLAARGHDFQLHLHPQWHGARFADGHWQLRPENETVDHLFATAEETTAYIAERKALLEDLLGGGKRVIAYRAGAFAARPGKKLLHALSRNDFQFDSSVVRGLFRQSGDYQLDYRTVVTQRRMWPVRDDVAHEDRSGKIWEVPIHSVTARRYQQITLSRLRAKFSRNVPARQQKQMVQRFVRPTRPLETWKALFEQVPIKLDFHNQTPNEFCRQVASAVPPPDAGDPDVLVAIGHSKEHVNDHAFDRLVGRLIAQEECTVTTFEGVSGLVRGREVQRVHQDASN